MMGAGFHSLKGSSKNPTSTNHLMSTVTEYDMLQHDTTEVKIQ